MQIDFGVAVRKSGLERRLKKMWKNKQSISIGRQTAAFGSKAPGTCEEVV